MANETTITIIGNLTADPELRFTPQGTAVASLTIASTPKTYNKQTQQWQDQETIFLRATGWRELAENIAETLTKGMRVIATGNLNSRSYKTREGENRTNLELTLTDIAPSLKYAKAQVTRNPQQQPQNQQQTRNQQTPTAPSASSDSSGAQQQYDPWATGTNASSDDNPNQQSMLGDEPPF